MRATFWKTLQTSPFSTHYADFGAFGFSGAGFSAVAGRLTLPAPASGRGAHPLASFKATAATTCHAGAAPRGPSPRPALAVRPRAVSGGAVVAPAPTQLWGGPSAAYAAQRLALQIRPNLLTSRLHLLLPASAVTAHPDAGALSAELTLVAATSVTVATALGFTRKQRKAFFIQQCLFSHMRRYLIVLAPGWLDLRLHGILPRLRSCWRALTRPTGELFAHPLTEELEADIGLTGAAARRVGSPEAWVEATLADVSVISEVGDEGLESGLAQLRTSLLSELQTRFSRRAGWRRFSVLWARVLVYQTNPHSYLKKRRARSIKRRQTKRLVRQTQYRF